MKIYFMETTFRDNSRAGYDDTFIDYSLTPFTSDEIGPTSVTYAVEVGEGYSDTQLRRLAEKALTLARDREIGIEEAIGALKSGRL